FRQCFSRLCSRIPQIAQVQLLRQSSRAKIRDKFCILSQQGTLRVCSLKSTRMASRIITAESKNRYMKDVPTLITSS
ncbi:unnamed protein product, partial [Cylicocyclus nassatus]